jgi:SAM-dependent methyltransferase
VTATTGSEALDAASLEQPPAGPRVLVLGAGRRPVALHLRPTLDAPEPSSVVTLDFVEAHEPDCLWDLTRPEPLPWPDDSFDELHAYEVLEHIGAQGDFRTFFRQFSDYWRVLKPDGHLCATVPMWDALWTWGDPGHTRVINRGTLVFLCQPSYTAQVGRTAMADYRQWYCADFQPTRVHEAGNQFRFVLRAVKPSRITS